MCLHPCWTIHSPVDGHVYRFQFLVIVDHVALNILIPSKKQDVCRCQRVEGEGSFPLLWREQTRFNLSLDVFLLKSSARGPPGPAWGGL